MISGNQVSNIKRLREQLRTATRNLSQPTDQGGGLAWFSLYQATFMPWWDSLGLSDSAEPDCLSGSPLQGGIMLRQYSPIPRSNIVEALSSFRNEWENSVDGDSLITIKASVGLLLYDISKVLGLSNEELRAILGFGLAEELNELLVQQPTVG